MYLAFAADEFSWFFFVLISFMCIVIGIYGTKYAEHLENRKRFFIFYGLTYVMLAGLCFASSYITMYLCFEGMILMSMPLVLHEGSPESIAAAKKYLFYLILGATLALLGIFFAADYANVNFVADGSLYAEVVVGHELAVRIAILLSIVGLCVAAAMFPLHDWLPTANSLAPAPVSALFSGIITKAGILCIIRVIFYVFGPEFIRGTWVQYALLGLSLLTIIFGSLMALQQDLLKKRLAYSTVAQVSCILFGIFTLNEAAMLGALLYIVYHSVIKSCLFMSAGASILINHKDRVSQLEGLGRKMPITFTCFTIASLGLIGISPVAAFLSKWYLTEKIPVFSWLGIVVLILSALMTAAYLLPVSIHAFFSSDKTACAECVEAPKGMWIPMAILAVLIIMLGVFTQPLVNVLNKIVGVIF